EAQYLQAKSALEQANLGVKMAKNTYLAMKEVLKSAKAAVEQAKLGVESAKARVEQAKAMVKEAEIALAYTEIRAPEEGIISQKFVEIGHLVWPGKVLLTLLREKELQLESLVPESIRNRIHIGQKLAVEVESIHYNQLGKVTEIIPSADPRSRTFLVKVAIPYAKGLYPGMFGTLLVPLEKEDTLLLPLSCVQRIGQFKSAYVKEGKTWHLRYLRLGKYYKSMVEVLSGLNAGETVGILRKEGKNG
ncbi:MAG: efflux RND transporter periplasmic adaptor subunit, partial [Planctomycetota bacterium]